MPFDALPVWLGVLCDKQAPKAALSLVAVTCTTPPAAGVAPSRPCYKDLQRGLLPYARRAGCVCIHQLNATMQCRQSSKMNRPLKDQASFGDAQKCYNSPHFGIRVQLHELLVI